MKIGSHYTDGNCRFTVWAPFARKISVVFTSGAKSTLPLKKDTKGYWTGETDKVAPGERYQYQIDEHQLRPDPASCYQPEGVHGPSEIIDHNSFEWSGSNNCLSEFRRSFFYEMHIGTFTEEGTFESAITQLDRLKDLGVNVLQVMPVAQFPGRRNWGYDGVYPFAVQNSYGGPVGFKKFINSAHQKGFRVFLDVVYNHMGPEGNYLSDYGPYFTKKYKTPWGEALNFDDAHSDGVRNFFIENAVHWADNFHIDGLRLDAVHSIFDMSAVKFLEDLRKRVAGISKAKGRKIYLIAESDLNDTTVFRPPEERGYGLDGVWLDDFHHALHALLTSEKKGYYADFGKVSDLSKAFSEGHIYSGQYSVYRKRKHGNSSIDLPAKKFVAFAQNHDQIGNRMRGDRLSEIISYEALKLTASCVMLSPYLPMLFMGEEFASKNPFPYFIDHNDPDLVDAVRNGRKKEFQSFGWDNEIPDPKGIETFKSAILRTKKSTAQQKTITVLYKELLALRNRLLNENALLRDNVSVSADESTGLLTVSMKGRINKFALYMNFGNVHLHLKKTDLSRSKLLDTASKKWMGEKKDSLEDTSSETKPDLFPKSSVLYIER